MAPFVYALIVHGVIGGIDVVLNHELIARLPAKPNAGPEQQLHSARELLFAAIFGSLAWFEWHGQFAWWIVALFVGELLVSTRDALLEADIRILPPTERVAHVFLFVNLGVVMTLLGQSLLAWHALPNAVVRVEYGWASWVLSALAAGSLAWAVRDGVNVLQRTRYAPA